MTVADVLLRPLVPDALLLALAAIAATALLLALLGRLPAAGWRLPPLLLLLGVLANPTLLREEQEPVPDVAVLVEDTSASMSAGERPEATAAVLESLAADLDGGRNLEVVTVEVPGGSAGTDLVSTIDRALVDVDRRRLAGTVIVSDGQVHDVPATLPAWARERPVHLLLPGREDETDRRLVLEAMPSYAMVGEPQRFRLRLADEAGGAASVTIRQNGQPLARVQVTPDRPIDVPFTLERAGETVIEAEVAGREGEVSEINNRTVAFVTGVRDRLRVLLVSGEPYPGLRVWRNLLKADPAVDLVHFTILRPPEKQDGTPVRELALIAFPVRELFELKLGEFDLIIFDRYTRRGLLPLAYFDNVATYVENGGALLVAAGPGFATPLSIARTPLERVIPAYPSGETPEDGYRPQVTELGDRHPVTEGLVRDWGGPWGPWYRMVGVETTAGQVVLQGLDERPLLVLDRVGDGRVAALLSDNAWLWARGYDEGGPQATLLRRLVHWLMQEPELEEERLVARPGDGRIEVERRSLSTEPREVTVTTPSGAELGLSLTADEDGVLRGAIAAEEQGLYRFDDGDESAFASLRPLAAEEMADLRATAAALAPLIEAGGGASTFTEDAGMPEVRRVGEDRARSGRGWIGLVENGRYRVIGSAETPLLPLWLALSLLIASQIFAWWREGRS